ncbi:MAG TPA: HYR domain-containing protein [Nitrosopumilaceae archaeon]|nr:HYR domain-containing protein [Nitrosopumilaceae archaeon]
MKTFPLLLIGIIAIVLSSTFIPYSSATTAPQYATQWGSYGLGKLGQFAFPQGISMDSAGNVYVTDLGNRRVEKFDFNGNFLDTWGTKGNGNGQFQAPSGIAVHGNSVYVVDNEQNTIQKFDTTGKFVTQWGSKGSNNGQFLLPQGIATDPSGDVYVADTGNSRIAKFSPDGKFITSIGQSGLGNGQFLSPRGVTADSQGSIYVADSGNNRIEKFTQDGVFLKTFSASSGSNFKTPLGLSVDSSGNIYITDTGNNQIVEINKDGNLLTSWGNQGTGPDFFNNPRDVTVDSAGNVYVVDSSNNRIQKFGSLSSPTPQNPTPTNQTQQNSIPKINPNDKTPPTITAPADMTVQASGMLTSVSIGQATATDDTTISSITNDAPSKFPLGTTIVTWTATDSGGNIAKAVQKITVIDTTAPTLTAPPNVTVEAKSPDHNSIDLGLPSAYDAVGVLSVTNDAPAYFPLGQTIVTWNAKDASGNAATAKQIVTVQDTTPPIIHAPSDITLEATSATNNIVNLGNATVTDNGIIQSVTNNAPKTFPIGTTTITWTAKDAAGNGATATQTVKIVDTTPPKLTPPPNVVFEATSMTDNHVPLGNATVTDNGIIQSVNNNAPKLFPLGKTSVLWTAKDAAGNISNATQTVAVVDTTPPKLTTPKDVTFEATSLNNNTVSLGTPTATDIDPVTITNNAPKVFHIGLTTVTWIAVDAAGNSANATQTIQVRDTTPPKLTTPKDIKVEATSLTDNIVSLGNATATDIDPVTITNNAPKLFPLGKTSVLWTAKDAAGNISNATQTVAVVDTTAPAIVVPKDVVVNATSSTSNHVEIGNATATDIDPVTITNNAPKVFPFGQTIVTWKATDTSGNSATATQKITVADRSPPQLNIPTDIVVNATAFETPIQVGQATATGIIDTSPKITNNATASFLLGKTIVKWNASDKFGNSKSLTQSVTVLACGKSVSSYNLVIGTSNDDILVGKSNIPNLIIGLGGNDIIRAGTAGDCIIAGNGDNVIFGGTGDDTIIAGNGNNIIKGGSGNERITVGTGSDIIYGGNGHNTCTVGNASHDTVVNCEIH